MDEYKVKKINNVKKPRRSPRNKNGSVLEEIRGVRVKGTNVIPQKASKSLLFDEFNSPLDYIDGGITVKQISKNLISIKPLLRDHREEVKQLKRVNTNQSLQQNTITSKTTSTWRGTNSKERTFKEFTQKEIDSNEIAFNRHDFQSNFMTEETTDLRFLPPVHKKISSPRQNDYSQDLQNKLNLKQLESQRSTKVEPKQIGELIHHQINQRQDKPGNESLQIMTNPDTHQSIVQPSTTQVNIHASSIQNSINTLIQPQTTNTNTPNFFFQKNSKPLTSKKITASFQSLTSPDNYHLCLKTILENITGNNTEKYLTDLKRIKENGQLPHVSEQKQMDAAKLNMIDVDGEKVKRDFIIKDEQTGSNHEKHPCCNQITFRSTMLSPKFNDQSSIETSQKPQTQSLMNIPILNSFSSNQHFNSILEHKNRQNQIPSFKNTTSRSDVQSLDIWLQTVLSQVYTKPDQSADEVLGSVQLIYSACLKELIRQVSLQCTERGLMIQKVWDAYLTLFERLIEQYTSEQRRQETNFLEDVSRIQKSYGAQMCSLHEQIEKLKLDIEEMNQAQETWMQSNISQKEQLDICQHDLRQKEVEIENLLTANKILVWDNQNIVNCFEQIRAEQERNFQTQEIFSKDVLLLMQKAEDNIMNSQIKSNQLIVLQEEEQKSEAIQNESKESTPKKKHMPYLSSKSRKDLLGKRLNSPIFKNKRSSKYISSKLIHEIQNTPSKSNQSMIGREHTINSKPVEKKLPSPSNSILVSSSDEENKLKEDHIKEVQVELIKQVQEEQIQYVQEEKIKEVQEEQIKQVQEEQIKQVQVEQIDQETQTHIEDVPIPKAEWKFPEAVSVEVKAEEVMEQTITDNILQKENYSVGQFDLNQLQEDIINNPSIEQGLRSKIEKAFTLIVQDKDNQIHTMIQEVEKKIAQAKEASIKQLESEIGEYKEQIDKGQRDINHFIKESEQLHDAQLEIEDYKDNVDDLSLKNVKLVNKLKEMTVIIKNHNGSVQKISELARLIVNEHKRSHTQNSSDNTISNLFDDSQFFQDDQKNEQDSIALVELIPMEAPQSSFSIQKDNPHKGLKKRQSIMPKLGNKQREWKQYEYQQSTRNIQKNKGVAMKSQNVLRKNKIEKLLLLIEDMQKENSIQKNEAEQDSDFGDLEEYMPVIIPERKSFSRLAVIKTTQASGPKLGYILRKDRTISVNADAALKLLAKTMERIQSKRYVVSQSKNNVIKFIVSVYMDRIKTPTSMQNPLYVIAYDNIMQKYGLKRVAENKMQQFLESSIKYSDNPRIKMFLRFMRIQDPYENQDFDFYIKFLKLIDEAGGNISSLFTQPFERIYTNFVL